MHPHVRAWWCVARPGRASPRRSGNTVAARMAGPRTVRRVGESRFLTPSRRRCAHPRLSRPGLALSNGVNRRRNAFALPGDTVYLGLHDEFMSFFDFALRQPEARRSPAGWRPQAMHACDELATGGRASACRRVLSGGLAMAGASGPLPSG